MQGKTDFDEQQNHFTYADEIPSYSDFLECLLAAGVIGYENLEQFIEIVKSYENLKKTMFFCPDTNILYHRFVTNLGFDLRSVLLVNVVRDEIEASLNFKYSPSQIAELKKDAKYQPFLLDEFVNRRMKKSRLACIALTEYRELRRYAVEIEGVEPSTNDKE